MMRLIAVEKNLINNKSGPVHWADVQDAFFKTQGLWSYRRDELTGHCWLDPRPDDDSIGLIYQNYYTHNDEVIGGSADLSLWNQAIAWAQSRTLGYEAPVDTPWRAKMASYMPTVTDAATLDVMRLPANRTGRLLDIGCGNGVFMKKMLARGWVVVGMEPDEKAAVRLAENEGLTVYRSLKDIAMGEPEPFNVVVLSHVIEHVPDPVQMMRELSPLVMEKSRLVVTTPNVSGLGARIFGRFWRGLEPPRHFNMFTPTSIKLAFHEAGFDVEKCTTEVRMARGIWYLSYLARKGDKDLEIERSKTHKGVKVAGYVFQLIEALLVKIVPSLGEELYCVGIMKKHSLECQCNQKVWPW